MLSDRVIAGLLGATDDIGAMIRDDMPRRPGTEDWEYRDIPWTTRAIWTHILSLAEGELLQIARSERGVEVRGQILVSPAAAERFKAYAQRKPS